MKTKTWDGKFTVRIDDGYLEESSNYIKSETAVIELFSETNSVTLEEVANAIISCTFPGFGIDRVVNSNLFKNLDIYLKIPKSPDTNVAYNFNIPNYQSTEKILSAIARDITI